MQKEFHYHQTALFNITDFRPASSITQTHGSREIFGVEAVWIVFNALCGFLDGMITP